MPLCPVAGQGPGQGDCRLRHKQELSVTPTPGYISSSSGGCRWKLRAGEGQTLQISLLAFGSGPDSDYESDSCYKIGLIMEGSRVKQSQAIQLCVPPHGPKGGVVYVSTGSTVSLELLPKEALQGVGPFILKYQGR